MLPLFVSILIVLGTAGSPPPTPSPPTFSLSLSWTAPGDDGKVGRAQSYSLPHSLAPHRATFARRLRGQTLPRDRRVRSRRHRPGAELNTVYYFALKTRDEAGNWSGLSNVVRYPSAPDCVDNLPAPAVGFSAPWPNPASTGIRVLTLPSGRRWRWTCSAYRAPRAEPGMAQGPPGAARWVDLRDESGGRVATGVYWVRARIADRVFSHPVTVVR